MKHLIAFFAFCLAITSTIQGQSTTRLSGKVTNARSTPVAGSTVYLLNTNSGTVSDDQGNFSFGNLPAGEYILQVSSIGYATVYKDVIIKGGETESLAIQLPEAGLQLDAVWVNAQKREELLQRVPLSITAISSRQVQQYRLWNNNELATIVPNLYSANSGDDRNVTSIRGITTTSYDPAVATYIDGVNQFGLDTYIATLFDIERIEVLRGPQGTLYGRNAMGGVINIITKQPSNSTSGFAEISFGNYKQQRYSLGLRTPLVKNKLYVGLAGLYDKRHGFYTNQFNNSSFDKQNSFTGNYYLKYIAGSHWDFTINVKHHNNRNNGAFTLVNGVDEALKNPFILNQNAVAKMVDDIFNSSLIVKYSGSSFNFSSQTAWQSNHRYYDKPLDGDFSPIDGVTIINNYGNDWNNVKVMTQEFKFSSPASTTSRLKWTAGSYLFHQDNPVKQTTHFGNDAMLLGAPDVNFGVINTTTAKSSGIAFFGQLSYSVNNKLDVIAGLRYDYEHKNYNVLGEYQKDPNPNPIFETRPDTSASANFSAVSPKLGIAYKLSANSNAFATYSRGYRTGGFTQLSSDPSQPPLYPYKPEYSNNIELGIKNNLCNNRLRLNAALFMTLVNDAQVPTLVLPDAITVTRNAGKLTSKGIELELSSTPVKGLQADYNFGYTDATYKTLKLSQNGSTVDLDGKKQVFTPDVTSMLALQYGIDLGSRQLKLVFRGEWLYTGKQYFDLSNNISQDGYSLFNTRFGLSFKKAELMFWGRNLADKKYIAYAYDFGAVHLGNPKTYGITLTGRF
ncbi:MAG TPA: TonB-dependent receptor [Chitinophagaceae bacterium]|nr:TonB-dependent receptor [Chitinophagaceae bacterium]